MINQETYKRLTKKGGYTKDLDLKQELGYSHIYNHLAELEDKIMDGTLIEFNKPFYSNQFNAWCIYLKDGDYITSLCLTKEQAEEYQKKLQEKQEYELSFFI